MIRETIFIGKKLSFSAPTLIFYCAIINGIFLTALVLVLFSRSAWIFVVAMGVLHLPHCLDMPHTRIDSQGMKPGSVRLYFQKLVCVLHDAYKIRGGKCKL